MIHLLLAAAEPQELDCARKIYKKMTAQMEGTLQIDFLLTGIGEVSTCYRLTRQIMEAQMTGQPYDLLIDLGIAGCYDEESCPIGSAAVISEEYFGELGFETPEGFKSLFDCETLSPDEPPYQKGRLKRPVLPFPHLEALLDQYASAIGMTIQTITSDQEKVGQRHRRHHCGVESMEGAAFYYIALLEKIPFFELRTISNVAGESDSSKWETQAALKQLEKCCEDILSALLQETDSKSDQ